MAVMTRITTNMIQRNYQNNLTATLGGLESSRRQVETGRRFQYSYEDPAASARAAVLERRYSRVQDYLDNIDDAQAWQNTQEDAAMAVEDYATTINKNYSIQAVNGTNIDKSIRETYATSIQSLQEAIVTSLNARYGDTYVLAGNEGKSPAFTLEDGVLKYRGQDVDTLTSDDPLLNEHSYVDVGFGLTIDGDDVVSSSAFDAALPGVKLVGYDLNDEGVSNNLVNLAGQMAEELRKDEFDEEAYRKLWLQFEDTTNKLTDQVSVLGTKTQLLTSTKDRLENEKLSIETQFDDAVNIEPAEAIMNYSWANYAYNSALKVGASLITPSLLDFIS